MRRVLNILQATSMGRDVITEDAVYQCTGDPLPADIKFVVETLLTASFTEAYERRRSQCLLTLVSCVRLAVMVAAQALGRCALKKATL
jgi:DNA polymerase III delta prime subunit